MGRRDRNARLREIAQRKRRLMREAGVVDPLLTGSIQESGATSPSSSCSSSSSDSSDSDSDDATEEAGSSHLEVMSCVCDHLNSPGAVEVRAQMGINISEEGYKLLQDRLLELNN